MIRDAVERLFTPMLNSLSNRNINADPGLVLITIALFYIGKALFDIADNLKRS